MFAIRIIYVDHCVIKHTCRLTSDKSVNARGGLLASTDEIFAILAIFAVEQTHKVAAVVDKQVGRVRNSSDKVVFVALLISSVNSVDLKSVVNEGSGNVVLR